MTRYNSFSLLFQAFLVMESAVTFGESGNATSSRLLLCRGLVLSLVEKSVMIHPAGRQKGWMVNQPGRRSR